MYPSNIIQSAWVVADLESAIRYWTTIFRVGPFFIIPNCKVDDYKYRGRPGALSFSGALAQAGDVQIELLQQHGDEPSAYRDVYRSGESGFHHIGLITRSLDEDLARYTKAGISIAHDGKFGDMRFAYLDTRATLGCMTELIEERQSILTLFREVANAAATWNGDEPIRYF